MSTQVHSGQGDELDYAYENIKKCLSQINEKIESEILLGNCLNSLEELRNQFKNIYQEIQLLYAAFSDDEMLYQKNLLREALDALIEFSIAYSLLEEKNIPQFYEHLKICIEHLRKMKFYIEDRFSVLRSKEIFEEEKTIKLSLMELVCSFENSLPFWQELFEVEDRRLKDGGYFAERPELFHQTLVDIHIHLQKICEAMDGGTLEKIEGELDSYYRLHILFCYLEQQTRKVVMSSKSASLGSSSRSKQARKLEMQMHRDLENVLLTYKSMPEAISRWKASKAWRKERPVRNENRHLRLVTSYKEGCL